VSLEKQNALEQSGSGGKESGVLDPLTRTLMSYEDDQDLKGRIDGIFDR
jgi:hypothetical protein